MVSEILASLFFILFICGSVFFGIPAIFEPELRVMGGAFCVVFLILARKCLKWYRTAHDRRVFPKINYEEKPWDDQKGYYLSERIPLNVIVNPEPTVEKSIRNEALTDPAELTPTEYEEYVAEYLRMQGYREVRVTQASGDYGIDVIGTNSEGWEIAIQCKRYHGSVGVAAVQEAVAGREYYNCDLAAVYTTGSYTQQAISLARKVHVKLYILDKEGLRVAS